MYANIFGKDNGDFTRYWASVATERYDSKKKKGTGEYVRATIPVRLSKGAVGTFDSTARKTKTKKIKGGHYLVGEFWLEAVEPKEGEPYVRLFVNDLEPVENDEDD